MTRKDEFDDPEGFQSAFEKIAQAMEQGRVCLRQRRPLIGLLTVMVALFVLFAVFWSTYPRGGEKAGKDTPVPVVRADTAPYKIVPEDPGGMEIPYRDSTVFETLNHADDREESKVESLLPPPEEPIDRAQMFAGLKTEPIEGNLEKEPDIGPITSARVADPKPQEPVVQTPEVKPDPPKVDEKIPVVKKPVTSSDPAKTAPEPTSGGTHYVQLGSLKDRAAANAEWVKLQKQFPTELGKLTLRVQEVDLGAKGKFFRIQGGAIAKEQAQKICSSISSQRAGGCLVVAR